MIDSIEKYLSELRSEMRSSDIATIQDALNDAEDHLTSALAEALSADPDLNEADALQAIVEEYGSPGETAESYSEMERRFVPSSLGRKAAPRTDNAAGRFFSIFADTSAWGAVLYSLLSLATGIIYFTWAVTGISISASLMILIIGIPIALGFFFSFHGLAFLEGRIVEGLLGVRMPRRQRFFDAGMKWGDKVKRLLLKADSWMFILYFIIMLPLGIIYFTLTVTLFSASLGLIVSPLLGIIFGTEWFDIGTVVYSVPYWTLPFFTAVGVILMKGSLHLMKGIGKLHGRMAKAMLISRE